MAKVRCISEDILNNDNFISLPTSARLLYVYCNQATDNLGFIDSMTIAIAKAKAKEKDLQLLLDREYIYQVKDWLYLEVHFRLNNKNLRPERGAKSRFARLLDNYYLDTERGMYMPSKCRHIGENLAAICLEKSEQNNTNKNNINEINTKEELKEFLRRSHE